MKNFFIILLVSFSLFGCASIESEKIERNADISDLHITYLGPIGLDLEEYHKTFEKDYAYLISIYNGLHSMSETSIQRLSMNSSSAESVFGSTFGSISGLLGLPGQTPIIPRLQALNTSNSSK